MKYMMGAVRIGLAIGLGSLTTFASWAGWDEGQAAFESRNYVEAMTHLRPLAEQGDARAQVQLGRMYRWGLGVKADPQAALAWFRKGEAQGSASAIFMIAEMTEAGEGGPADLARAVEAYQRSASLGYAPALAVLGAMHADGYGVAQDDALAIQWYERAAAQDNGMALTNLGRMHRDGQGVQRDLKKAFALFERSAKLGHPRGQAELGIAYLDGLGVNEDAATGVKWLQASAAAGSALGQFRLAWAHLEGQGIAEDATKAAELFKLSAEQGHSGSMRELGKRFESGEGVSKDLAQARAWYERAAEAGDALAMYHLGSLHDEGRGVPSDKAHAVYWYLRAARRGEANALNDLGAMYFNSEFVAKDDVLAHALFMRAAEVNPQGNGQKNLERTRSELSWPDRRKAEKLSEKLSTPEGFDAALDASLVAAQGLVPQLQVPSTECLPQPPQPSQAQMNAWAADAHDRGFLWRVRKGERTSYVYGTMHVAKLPWISPGPNLLAALGQSDMVAVESDLAGPEVQRAVEARRNAAPKVSSPELQAELDEALGPACVQQARSTNASQFRQAMMVVLRDSAALNMHVAASPDVLLPAVGRAKRLPVTSLENVEDALRRTEPGSAQENLVRIRLTLSKGRDTRRKQLERLAQVWERGDFEQMQTYESWCECAETAENKALLTRLNDERNAGMAERIDSLHVQGQRVLAAVGALHMTGPQSLLKLLESKGYTIERVQPQRPPGSTPSEIRVTVAGAAAR